MAHQPSGLVNAKAILEKEQQKYYWNFCWKDNEFHNFPKGISTKLNVIAQLEFELA